MKKNPLITVLMSVYNGEKFLKEAIESILNQSFMDFEFLIINDGSIDASKEIILSYDDPRITFIDNYKNIGIPRSVNKGISLAKGKYIARMDADDISLPERLERQVAFMEDNEDIAMCGGWAYIINFDGSILQEAKMETDTDKIIFNLFFGNQFFHGSTVSRTDILSHLKYDINATIAQDYDLWFRMAACQYKLVNIPAFIYKYRAHSASISIHNHEEEGYEEQEKQVTYIVKKAIKLIMNMDIDHRSIHSLRKLYLITDERMSVYEYIRNYFLIKKLYNGLIKKTNVSELSKAKYNALYKDKIRRLNECFLKRKF